MPIHGVSPRREIGKGLTIEVETPIVKIDTLTLLAPGLHGCQWGAD